MNIDKAIERFVCCSDDYTFTTDLIGLVCPKFIWPKGSKDKIKLEGHRDLLLSNRDSEMSKEFRKDLAKLHKGYQYEREVPIIISDIEKWKELANRFGTPPEKTGVSYFMVDYFFPDLDLILEVDGSMWHCPEYDKARDAYIKSTYGYKTLRFLDYGKSNIDLAKDQVRLSQEFAKAAQRKQRYHFRRPRLMSMYVPELVQYYKRKNWDAINLVEKILNYKGPTSMSSDKIAIGAKEVRSFWPKLTEPLILNAMEVMQELYGTDLEILKTL